MCVLFRKLMFMLSEGGFICSVSILVLMICNLGGCLGLRAEVTKLHATALLEDGGAELALPLPLCKHLGQCQLKCLYGHMRVKGACLIVIGGNGAEVKARR